MVLKYKTTKDIEVSKKIIDQVIGQDKAVEIIKKSAEQRRHVLLIGEPGTGKSMLGLALAELIPKENLVDVVSFANPDDENQPLIRTMPSGDARGLVQKSRLESTNLFKNQNIFLFILVIISMIVPWWVRSKYQSDIMFAAFFLGGMVFLAAFILFLNLGRRVNGKVNIPKIIVDNFRKKQAPFLDATGAHAGALLGDVLHDPFQTFSRQMSLNVRQEDDQYLTKDIQFELDKHFAKNKILKKEKNNYEAIHLPKNELFVLGETNGSVSPVEVLSCNRYEYYGNMIKLTTAKNKELIVTPEHKIAISKNGRIEYVEASKVKTGDKVVGNSEDIIIDEQDIINTYSEEQQDLSKSYYDYLNLRGKNPSWGYKRIATKLGVSYGRTRWWWEKKTSPVPVQTVEWLKERGLLPLKINNPKLFIISKVLGATFGDGGIFENLNGIFLSSSEKEAVEEFGKDIEKIFRLNKNNNSRIIEGGEYGHSWCYQNTNRNIIRFFLALGAPKGNKTNIELKTPNWIKINKKLGDEFFGSFIGGELGTPIIHKNGNYLTSLEIGITGIPQLKSNRLEFLNKLSGHLKKNRVNTTSIYEGKSKTKDSLVFRLLIEKKLDNVLLFMMNVKINYCKYKVKRLYKALGQWAEKKKTKYQELLNRGYGAEHAMKTLNLTPNSLYLLLNHFGPQEANA